ncbi:MAG TPA: NAD-dependent succinate-semialdehyde dehydrogenase [Advenella sp.]|nr:NAD-dependent succinate-semialdehyde dehydrogenase [Advenella sp.]
MRNIKDNPAETVSGGTTTAYPQALALYIGGQWRGVQGRETLAVRNPSTETVLGMLPVATNEDVDDALSQAETTFAVWSRTNAWDRANILGRAAQLVDARRHELAVALTLENGKPLADSDGEIGRVIEAIVYCAEECKRAYGRQLPPRSPLLTQTTVKRPIGPVAAFVPWNFPAFLAARKVAAALATGCTVVLKAPEETPAIGMLLVQAFLDAGVPPGAISLLYGRPAQISERLIASPIIRKISFTGSVPVGKLLATQASQYLKPATMELGGHAPVIVCDDVDAAQVAQACVAFKYRNSGQVCLSPSRFFVQEGIYDRFVEHFIEHARNLKVGDGLDTSVQMGPLNNQRRLAAAAELVDDAQRRGATVQLGGKRLARDGYFFPPTVVTDLPADARILHEEPFCPVAPILPFSTLDEAIGRANAVEYGLAAYAFTNCLERAATFTDRIESAWIGVNNFTPSLADAPVGGVKDSGLGYEGGPEGLDAYQQIRFISQSNTRV